MEIKKGQPYADFLLTAKHYTFVSTFSANKYIFYNNSIDTHYEWETTTSLELEMCIQVSTNQNSH